MRLLPRHVPGVADGVELVHPAQSGEVLSVTAVAASGDVAASGVSGEVPGSGEVPTVDARGVAGVGACGVSCEPRGAVARAGDQPAA
jgi:hypothetical protein